MEHQRDISVIGLGYVGLSTAVAFSKHQKVIAFDISPTRINELKNGMDKNHEVPYQDLKSPHLFFTNQADDLKAANFHIISVPTPLDKNNKPDLSILMDASQQLGKHLKRGDIVIYESTVYPGGTEDMCIPVLVSASHLIYGKDFTVGFSPERINPADKEHIFTNIVKVVSGSDENTLDIVAHVYQTVVEAGIHRAPSIKVAEACKVIENIQRDVNIALMNDIAIMLHKMGIETTDVIAAMQTKWNHLTFKPGLVGGHCIGVNSYYWMHKAQEINHYCEIISASRQANEYIPKFIVDETLKCLINKNILIKGSRIAVLGLAYKENCPDLRSTRVIDIIRSLKTYGVQLFVNDPIVDPDQAKTECGIELTAMADLKNLDAIIFTVAHDQFRQLTKPDIIKILRPNGVIIDVKEIFNADQLTGTDIMLWRL